MELNCRVCLQVRDVMVYLFDEVDPFQKELAKLLEEYGDLEVKEDDNFPKHLCQQCTQELLIVVEFREKCRNSNVLLHAMESTNEISENSIHSEDVITFDPSIIEHESYCEEENEIETEVEHNSIAADTSDNAIQQIYKEDCIEMSTAEEDEIDKAIDEWISKECFLDKEVEENSLLMEDIEPTSKEEQTVENDETASSYTTVADENVLSCKECGAVFVKPINLQRHLKSEHNIITNIFCENCQRKFNSRIAYEEHRTNCIETDPIKRLKATKNPKNTTCHFCGRNFQSNFALQMHVRTHTGERPFGCDICSSQFKTQSALTIHKKRHTSTADIECEVCHKRFFEKSNLVAHMRTHTGDRPHVCNICHKGFSRVYLLQLHMRTHTGERPFQCDHCDRSFAQRSDWKSHLSIHTGERRFQCDLCSKGFMKRQQFELHKEKHRLQTNTNDSLNFEVSIRAETDEPDDNLLTDMDTTLYINDLIVEHESCT